MLAELAERRCGLSSTSILTTEVREVESRREEGAGGESSAAERGPETLWNLPEGRASMLVALLAGEGGGTGKVKLNTGYIFFFIVILWNGPEVFG